MKVLCRVLCTSIILSCLLLSVEGWKPSETLHVHVVPHSHNDPGWWNTFEHYYNEWTRGILTSIMKVLSENEDRTFIWAEISFFQRWWSEQDDSMKNQVKKFAESKRLEFVTGGWVMNDEANVHMIDVINQLTEGHEWLYNNLGVKPRVGWAIDPFGHSATMPFVLQSMGFSHMVINRIHKDKKAELRNNKKLEFHWQSENNNTGPNFDILTHVFPWKLYDIPNTCGPDWDTCVKFDFERDGVAIPITQNNVAERSKVLVNMYKKKAELFHHNHVLIPLGDDFKYKTDYMTRRIMTQYEMMFDYINNDKSLNTVIKFSTLSRYFDAVQEWEDAQREKLGAYKGDFFTYCDEDQDYWSGYFTTRPFMKGLTRNAQAVLRTGETLHALETSVIGGNDAKPRRKTWSSFIEKARWNIGLFQHHDGVTGTARRQVVQDYAQRLHDSMWEVANAAQEMASSLLKKTDTTATTSFVWSHTATGPTLIPAPRVLPIGDNGISVVVAYNSLQHARSEVISVYVSSSNVKVTDADGNEMQTQIDPVWGESGSVAIDRFLLHFIAKVPALGFTTFFLENSQQTSSQTRATVSSYEGTDDVSTTPLMKNWDMTKKSRSSVDGVKISNQHYSVTFGSEGTIKEIVRRSSGEDIDIKVNQEFLSYTTYRSGAYLFLPNGPAGSPQSASGLRFVEGPIVKTVYAKMKDAPVNEFVVHLFECSKSGYCPMSQGIEILHSVDMRNKFTNTEVITRYTTTNMDNNNIFYTDSNGLDMRKRVYVESNPIQANYYPITSACYMEDNTKRLTILAHQAHGVGSVSKGSIEVMLDRHLRQDDGRGLGEPVTDNVYTQIPLWLVVEDISPVYSSSSTPTPALTPTSHAVWQTRNYPIQQLYTKEAITNIDDYKSKNYLQITPLLTNNNKKIPDDVQLLTLAPRGVGSDEVLMRLYVPPSTRTTTSSKYIGSIDMFTHFKPIHTKEMLLSMMHEKKIIHDDDDMLFSMRPSEIKTFVFTTTPKQTSRDVLMIDNNNNDDNNNNNNNNDNIVDLDIDVVDEDGDGDGGDVRDDDVVVVGERHPGDEKKDEGEGLKPVDRPPKGDTPADDLKEDVKKDVGGGVKKDAGGGVKKGGEKKSGGGVGGGVGGGGVKKGGSKKKVQKEREEEKKPNIFATTVIMYLGVVVLLFVGGYMCGRSKKGAAGAGLFSITPRDESVAKML